MEYPTKQLELTWLNLIEQLAYLMLFSQEMNKYSKVRAWIRYAKIP